ncbi:MAG: methyltransferase domain-containing protein [Rhizobiaceae bacterium]
MSIIPVDHAVIPHRRRPDWIRFLAAWLRAPLRTGAIAPSSKALAAEMAFCAAVRPGMRVLELGSGTGAVTETLLSAGVSQSDLTLVEADPGLAELLRQRFPLARVVCGDAFRAVESLLDAGAEIDAVVSSLPLLVYPKRKRLALCSNAAALVGPYGRVVQFTYGISSPVARMPRIARTASRRIWRNLPPAMVWTYRAKLSDAATPARSRDTRTSF